MSACVLSVSVCMAALRVEAHKATTATTPAIYIQARQWTLLCPAQHAMSGLVRGARAARPPARRPRLRTPTAGVFAGRARCVHGLSHVSPDGQTPRMVDVSKKDVTLRTAVALRFTLAEDGPITTAFGKSLKHVWLTGINLTCARLARATREV